MKPKSKIKNKPHPNEALIPHGSRPCPFCGATMTAEKVKGITLDVCPEHGIWSDKGELERIISRMTRRFNSKLRRHVDRAQESGTASTLGFLELAFNIADSASGDDGD